MFYSIIFFQTMIALPLIVFHWWIQRVIFPFFSYRVSSILFKVLLCNSIDKKREEFYRIISHLMNATEIHLSKCMLIYTFIDRINVSEFMRLAGWLIDWLICCVCFSSLFVFLQNKVMVVIVNMLLDAKSLISSYLGFFFVWARNVELCQS